MVKVAINGFGRIGRLVFRAGVKDKNIDWVAINDLTDTKTLAHLLKHDSVHGKLDVEVSYDKENLIVDGKKIRVFAKRDPEELPWGELGVEVVAECTGFFRDKDKAMKHVRAGAKKVVISAPSKDADITIVRGVNEHDYDKEKHVVISNASCTTNCLAPVVKVLNDNFGIVHGFITTTHAFTADQRIVDGPHSDLRRARSASINITPTSTGAAVAVAKVIPELAGKLDGIALRVPVPDGSITDLVCHLKKDVTVKQINDLFKNVASKELKDVLEYSEDPLVSTDIIDNPHSSIVDAGLTRVIDGKLLKIVSWYDNEWGYSNRMIDLINMLL